MRPLAKAKRSEAEADRHATLGQCKGKGKVKQMANVSIYNILNKRAEKKNRSKILSNR